MVAVIAEGYEYLCSKATDPVLHCTAKIRIWEKRAGSRNSPKLRTASVRLLARQPGRERLVTLLGSMNLRLVDG